MIQKIKSKADSFHEGFGKLSHSVQFLKLFSFGQMVLLLMLSAALISQIGKEPVVMALDVSAVKLNRITVPDLKSQIREAIVQYLDLRYKWDAKTIEAKLEDAERFIAPASIKAFRRATSSIKAFSTEKQISQRAYPADIEIDLGAKSAEITGDRITSIQGVMAAGKLVLGLDFEYGQRSPANPWGIYIVKEKEEAF